MRPNPSRGSEAPGSSPGPAPDPIRGQALEPLTLSRTPIRDKQPAVPPGNPGPREQAPSGSSLESIARLKEALQRRPQELAQARERGEKVVGYFCCNIPEELLHALGLIPLRLGRGGDEKLVELGARYISTKNCAFIRQCVGLFAQGEDPYIRSCNAVAVAATCLQIYRLAELIAHYFGVRTLVLGVPRNFTLPEGRRYFEQGMEELVRQLEGLAGRRLEEERLQEAIDLYAAIRRAILRLYRLQAGPEAPLSWRDLFEVLQAGFYLDRVQYLSLVQGLLAEVEVAMARDPGSGVRPLSRPNAEAGNPPVAGSESALQAGEAAGNGGPDGRPRMLLSGTLLAPGDTKLIDLIEALGGRIVADDLCSGLRPFLGLEVKEPSVAGVAAAYLDRVPCASLPYLGELESDRRLASLLRLIADYQAEGVIYHTLRYCDPFTFKANETHHFLQGRRIPFLEIHTEYASSDVESIRTRVEAFLELLERF